MGSSGYVTQVLIDHQMDLENILHANVFARIDKTVGDSGACGINHALVISMPFRLVKVS